VWAEAAGTLRPYLAPGGLPQVFNFGLVRSRWTRRRHPALATGPGGSDSTRWLEAPADALCFARDPGFLFLANVGAAPLRLPVFREVLLASGPLLRGATGLSDGSLPPDTAVWLSA
jgi:alpha-glucosidase